MKSIISRRFKGLLPVVIDVETAGLHADTHALLELAAVFLAAGEEGKLSIDFTESYHIEPFNGAEIDEEALSITGIKPHHPFRFAITETQALQRLFDTIKQEMTRHECYRAILVGHNAWFDLSFILAAAKRTKLRGRLPLHAFTTFDTASLAGVALGETVLAKAAKRARIPFDITKAHSAIYDAERTAELFCYIANKWRIG